MLSEENLERGGAEAKNFDGRSAKHLSILLAACCYSFKLDRRRLEIATISQKQEMRYLDINNICCMEDLSKKYGRLIIKDKDILMFSLSLYSWYLVTFSIFSLCGMNLIKK